MLRSVTASSIVIHDPAIGVRNVPLADLSKHFTGVVLELTPAANFRAVHAQRAGAPVEPVVADDRLRDRARRT